MLEVGILQKLERTPAPHVVALEMTKCKNLVSLPVTLSREPKSYERKTESVNNMGFKNPTHLSTQS